MKETMPNKYCESVYQTRRWPTREVKVGNVGVGGANPIRKQSMTTSPTRDAKATADQIMKLSDFGCEIARVTVQGMKEADACEEIKNILIQKGYTIPLVADIHFFPPAAMRVVEFCDKVRINPGNFVDKRASFKVIEYDDKTYAAELLKIEEKFSPLVLKCKLLKRAMRIGVNHGSLSDRVMNRYGDTPAGMVESAIEYAEVCRRHDYHDIIFSMKASNPIVMIQAYRLLVATMMEKGWNYPLHLGVTEAGQGEDGRIKSAIGMGSLLLDGLGDTIRVSLTEDPWHEIDPCQRLVEFAASYQGKGVPPFEEMYRNFMEIERRQVEYPKGISMHRSGTVILGLEAKDFKRDDFFDLVGCKSKNQQPHLNLDTADGLFLLTHKGADRKKIELLYEIGITTFSQYKESLHPEVEIQALDEIAFESFRMPMMQNHFQAIEVSQESATQWQKLLQIYPQVIFLSPRDNRLHYCRQFMDWLRRNHLAIPVILKFKYTCSQEDLVIQASSELGALLSDGIGEGILIEGDYDKAFLRKLSFGILQGCRMRTIKTEFISCPSCGRTLFDLQDVTKRIHERTSHLPGVKIAIMGCIVNGPGEMADADFGYVGSRPGKIDLYVGKERVERDIDFADADDRLVALIKAHDRWVDP
ncbi:MAG: 4-hydroxy-3-methylbut-2-en-1-yl diphosphate synthase [Chlamydiales bacterium]